MTHPRLVASTLLCQVTHAPRLNEPGHGVLDIDVHQSGAREGGLGFCSEV